jgi:hypothetical protein
MLRFIPLLAVAGGASILAVKETFSAFPYGLIYGGFAAGIVILIQCVCVSRSLKALSGSSCRRSEMTTGQIFGLPTSARCSYSSCFRNSLICIAIHCPLCTFSLSIHSLPKAETGCINLP